MTKGSNKRFNRLFIPILIEQFFFLLMSQIDILMLTGVGLSTVAAVGLANQVLMIVTFVLTIIHVGVSIRMIHIKEKQSLKVVKGEITQGIILNLFLTIVLSIIVIISIDFVLQILNIPQDVYVVTKHFSVILLSFTFVHTTNMIIGTILRIMDRAKYVTIVSILMNTINIVLNAYILYFARDQFTSPVEMVAWATNISRVIGLIILLYLVRYYITIIAIKRFNKHYFSKIFSLGLPSAGEHISYNFSQLVLTALIASMGTVAVSSKMLTQSITGLSFTFALSFSMANQIFLGRYIAKKRYQIFKRIVGRNIFISACISSLLVIMIAIIFWLIGSRHFGEQSLTIMMHLLLLSILLEPIRAMNVFFVQILNVLGDVRFPVMINIIVTWLLLVPGAFITVKIFGFGIETIFILMIMDELLRSCLMYYRFKNERWKINISRIGV